MLTRAAPGLQSCHTLGERPAAVLPAGRLHASGETGAPGAALGRNRKSDAKGQEPEPHRVPGDRRGCDAEVKEQNPQVKTPDAEWRTSVTTWSGEPVDFGQVRKRSDGSSGRLGQVVSAGCCTPPAVHFVGASLLVQPVEEAFTVISHA